MGRLLTPFLALSLAEPPSSPSDPSQLPPPIPSSNLSASNATRGVATRDSSQTSAEYNSSETFEVYNSSQSSAPSNSSESSVLPNSSHPLGASNSSQSPVLPNSTYSVGTSNSSPSAAADNSSQASEVFNSSDSSNSSNSSAASVSSNRCQSSLARICSLLLEKAPDSCNSSEVADTCPEACSRPTSFTEPSGGRTAVKQPLVSPSHPPREPEGGSILPVLIVLAAAAYMVHMYVKSRPPPRAKYAGRGNSDDEGIDLLGCMGNGNNRRQSRLAAQDACADRDDDAML
ncbi:MAG: hypothetical protein SGPRY_008638 [Prymnesium sp.]